MKPLKQSVVSSKRRKNGTGVRLDLQKEGSDAVIREGTATTEKKEITERIFLR